jgi:hypothetical protein
MKKAIIRALGTFLTTRFSNAETPEVSDDAAYSYDSLRGASSSGPRLSGILSTGTQARKSPSEAPTEVEYCRD